MNPLFGMTEAAEAAALVVGCGGPLPLYLGVAHGFFARSRVAAGATLLWALVLMWVLTPWTAFRSFVHHWICEWQDFAAWWVT